MTRTEENLKNPMNKTETNKSKVSTSLNSRLPRPNWRHAHCLVAIIGLMLWQSGLAAAVSLPFYDGIPSTYTAGGSLGASGVGNANWTLGAPDTNIVVTTTDAQSYPGLLAPASGSQGVLVKKISNENSLQSVGVNFNAVTTNGDGISTNVVYASFLLKVNARPTAADRCVVGLSSSTTYANVPVCAVELKTTGKLAVAKSTDGNQSAATGALTVSNTYLVVVRYSLIPGATNDTIDLWLNPANLGVAEGSVPAATIAGFSNNTNADPASIQSFFIPKQASGSDVASWSIDEIRLGTNWASVTPATPGPVSLPFYDGIPSTYTTGGALGSSDVGVTNWSLGAPDTNIVVTTTDAQSYPGLVPPAIGSQGVLVKTISNENSLQSVGVNFNPVTTNAVYASFLLKVNAKPTLSDRCIATLSSGTAVPGGGNGDLAVVLRTGGALALGRNGVSTISATNTSFLSLSTTYLVVVRYNFVPGLTNNDTVDLWLNPTVKTVLFQSVS